MLLADTARPDTPLSTADPIRQTLEHLARLSAGGDLIVSCYVRLEARDRIRTRYRLAVRAAIDAVRPAFAAGNAEQVLHDCHRIEQYLSEARSLPHADGLGIFACESLGLFEVVPLPRVLKTRLRVADRAQIAEIVAAVEGFGRLLVAALDRAHVRFFAVEPFAVTELPGLVPTATRGGKFHSDRADSPGWGEHDFHNRIREERHRLSGLVARQLATLLREGAWQGVVLAGPSRATGDLMRFLPTILRERIIGVVRLNPTAVTASEVRTAAQRARAEWIERHEMALVAELREAMGTGWATLGPRSTLKALHHGQVRVLLVREGESIPGYRCSESGRLVLTRADGRGEGDPIPVPDVVNEALEEAIGQDVQVVLLQDPEAIQKLGGMGALLRFR
jgi:peptide subunit release factor 1 (eRF1)